MKLNFLILGFIFSTLLFSCKDLENKPNSVESTKHQIWQPQRMEISGPTVNGIVTIVDSSAYLKSFPKLALMEEAISPNNFFVVANENQQDVEYLKDILSKASYYNLKISIQEKYLLLHFNEFPSNPKRVTTYYYEKAQ